MEGERRIRNSKTNKIPAPQSLVIIAPPKGPTSPTPVSSCSYSYRCGGGEGGEKEMGKYGGGMWDEDTWETNMGRLEGVLPFSRQKSTLSFKAIHF